jgi:prolyl 4-hydroxylase
MSRSLSMPVRATPGSARFCPVAPFPIRLGMAHVPGMSIPQKNDVCFTGESIVTVSGFLSPDECDGFIQLTEAAGFGDAPITTFRGFVMAPELRNNTRVILDDVALARRLWARMEPFACARIGSFRAIGLNERFRYYRYDPGQYFKYHRDGAFIRSVDEQSLWTAMIYLNDDFEGGSTDFTDSDSIRPRRGMLLLFEHGLRHQGSPVTRGRKYVLRTDVMYRRS